MTPVKINKTVIFVVVALFCLFHSVTHAAYRWQTSRGQLNELHALLDRHPEKFAGVSLDWPKRQVIVRTAGQQHLQAVEALLDGLSRNRQQPSPAFEEPLNIVIEVTERSTAQLQSIQAVIRQHAELKEILEPVFVQWNIDIKNNRVDIGVVDITARLEQAMRENFGAAVALYETAAPQIYSRQVATADGKVRGGALTHTNINCSTGWSVRHVTLEPLTGFLTAGHCLRSNFEVGPATPTSNFLDINDVYMGTGFAWRFGDWSEQTGFEASWSQDTDAAVVFDMLFSNQAVPKASVYTGGPNSNSKAYVIAQDTPTLGDFVCFSGVKTGENCNAVITRTGLEKTSFVGFGFSATIRNLVEAQSWDGSIIAQKGDSGGPVYIKQTSLGTAFVAALGIIQGGPEDPSVAGQPSAIAHFAPISDAIPQNWQLKIASCTLDWWTWSWQCTE